MSKRPTADPEVAIMLRHMRDYATLTIEARNRVHHYVGDRLNSLPVLAAVGGGTEDDAGDQPLPFHRDQEAAA